jgi:hypothetical protein
VSALEARELVFSRDRPLEAGRYRHETFDPSFTFEVPTGWFAVQDVPAFFDVEQEVGALDVIAVQFARPSDLGTADGAAETIEARSGLVLSELRGITLGGLPGTRFVVDAADPDLDAQRFVPVLSIPLGPISIASGRRLELRLIDLPSGLFGALVGGSVRDWAATIASAEPILASIAFD